jgi:IS5 family transposase
VGTNHKLITRYTVTDAAVHDSQELKILVKPGKDKRIYADSSYTGEGRICIWEYDESDGWNNDSEYRESTGGICDRDDESGV